MCIFVPILISRSSLMTGGHGSGPGVNPWLVNESEETRGLGFGEIKHQQQQIIEGILHIRLLCNFFGLLTDVTLDMVSSWPPLSAVKMILYVLMG